MSRVKFNVTSDWQYIANLKILQNCFDKHDIQRTIPIQSLVKCKMQDNLEFLQWTKRFWDQNYPGDEEYDAIARRKASGAPAPAATPRAAATGAARRGVTPTSKPAVRKAAGAGGVASSALSSENALLKETVTGLERERDFYFSKLRDIELLIQQAIDLDPSIEEQDEESLIKTIQKTLYSTEVRF